MTAIKMTRAWQIAGIPAMPTVRAHIERQAAQAATAEVLDSMTSRQLGALLKALHLAYHDGRASTGAQCLDGNVDDGLYFFADGKGDGVAITMRNGLPSVQ
jgi:hypothetical protein